MSRTSSSANLFLVGFFLISFSFSTTPLYACYGAPDGEGPPCPSPTPTPTPSPTPTPTATPSPTSTPTPTPTPTPAPQPNPQQIAETGVTNGEASDAENADPSENPTVNGPLESPAPVVGADTEGETKAGDSLPPIDEQKPLAEAPQSPDPVRYSTGELITSDDDLSVSVDGMTLKVSRTNISSKSLWSSLGNWSTSFDSRVIWGVQPYVGLDPLDPAGLVFQTNAKQAALEDNHQTASDAFEILLGTIQEKLTYYTNKYNTFTWDPQTNSSGQALHDAYERARDAYQDLLDRTNAYYLPRLSALYDQYLAAKADYERALSMAALARANLARDARTWHATDPTEWRDLGNGFVVLVDPEGVPHRFQLTASPVYDSTSTYTDGLPNFYPSGSATIGPPGTGEVLTLSPEGRFLWKHKNGEIWTYNFYGQLIQRQEAHGNLLKYQYDDQNLLASITDKRERTILTLNRDPGQGNRLTSLVDVASRRVEYSYDTSGRLFSVKDTSGDVIQYLYDSADRLTRIIKPDDSYRNYVYNLITGKVSSDADEENNSESFQYLADNQGHPYTLYTDAADVWEMHFYDPVKFHDTKVVYANGREVTYEYDSLNRVKKETWNTNLKREFTYDSNGNLIERKNFDGTVESWLYDENSVLESYTDARNNKTVFENQGYDITGIDYPGFDSEVYRYNLDGTLDTHTNAKLGVREFDYDANGYLSRVTYLGSGQFFSEKFVNDALGRVVLYEDAAGVKTRYRYRADGSLETVIYPDGRAKVLSYSNRKDKTREETRRYLGKNGDQVAELTPSQFSDPVRFEVLDFTTLVYDKRHKLTSLVNSLNQSVHYTYDGFGKPLTKRILDDKGAPVSLTSYTYDGAGQVISTSVVGKGIPDPITRNYRYDALGRVVLEQDERGVWKRSSYDPLTGQLTEQALLVEGNEPDWGTWKTLTSLDYDQGLVEQSEDWRGTLRRFAYDERGRLQSVQARFENQWKPVQELSFDPSGGVAQRIEGGVTKTQWDYDVWGNTVAERNALALKEGRSASSRREYDGRGLVTKVTDDAGLVTLYDWDELRRLTSVTQTDSAGTLLSKVSREYRFVNKKLNIIETDSRNVVRTRIYDALSRVTQEINGYGKSRFYQYDVLGNVTKITDETGRTTQLDYDGLGRRLSHRQGSQVVGFYTYDGAGNLLSKTDGEDRVTTYRYDRFGRLVEEKVGVTLQGAQLVTTYTFDDNQHKVVRQTGSFVHTYRYDEWARLAEETDAAGEVQSYRYNDAGNLKTKRDYKKQDWSYEYSPLNQLASVKVGEKLLGTYQYDRMGRLTSALGADARNWYQYDLQGNLIKQEDDAGTVFTFGYDAAGLRTSLQRGEGSPTRYTYGKEGELTALEDSAHNQSFFSYDDAGREIQVVETNGMTRQTQYDEVGRISFIREVKTETRDRDRHWDDDDDDWGSHFFGYRGWGRGHRTPAWGEAYAYNDAGQVSLKANLSGDVTLFDYDEAARLEQARYSYGTSGRWEAFEKELKRYRLNSHSNHDQPSKSLKNTVKQLLGDVYYQMGGLSSVRWDQKLWSETHQYDSAGNRKKVSATRGTIEYSYDTNNRLTKAGNRSYTYDANGNQLTETVGDETVVMGYTEDNRIKSYDRTWTGSQVAEDPEAEDETPHKVSYTYDPLGRRVSKSQRGFEGVKTQEYQYDGLSLDLIRIADAQKLAPTEEEAEEEELLRKPVIEDARVRVIKPRNHDRDESKGIDILYANGRVFSSLSQNKGLTIYTTDYLGSVRFTTNSHDSARHEYNYDAFGVSMGKKPELFGYNGKVYDAVTANYDYGFRDYAPKQARFTTVDPIQDGSNWYAYVNNDPINFVDPTGLTRELSYSSNPMDLYEQVTGISSSVYYGNDMLFPTDSDSGLSSFAGLRVGDFSLSQATYNPRYMGMGYQVDSKPNDVVHIPSSNNYFFDPVILSLSVTDNLRSSTGINSPLIGGGTQNFIHTYLTPDAPTLVRPGAETPIARVEVGLALMSNDNLVLSTGLTLGDKTGVNASAIAYAKGDLASGMVYANATFGTLPEFSGGSGLESVGGRLQFGGRVDVNLGSSMTLGVSVGYDLNTVRPDQNNDNVAIHLGWR